MQSIYAAYDDSKAIKLADWSAISGFLFWVLAAAVPSFHYLRPFSAISILLIFMFVFIVIGTTVHDGQPWPLFLMTPFGMSSLFKIALRASHAP